jgi:hydrogenase maturation protease
MGEGNGLIKRFKKSTIPSKMASEKGLWVIGYGNPQRRDDGIGQRVISLLMEEMKDKEGVHFLATHQLSPEIVEELKDASYVIFIDASIEKIEGGWRWIELNYEERNFGCLMHHIKLPFILGLIQSIYRKKPPKAWLISIQGDDFDFGEGLSPHAEERARKVASEISRFLEDEGSFECKRSYQISK